ncbi:hypothetical protein SH2C18_03750 [Clostridium sediminicola]|uniref:molybdopterin-dependent oxidoreductase n=1 Tax=Clostridium sediminicola TaxID=3114879 RepID=UPI0031F27AB8
MRKNKLKVLAMVMVVLSVFMLSACGKNSKSTSSVSSGSEYTYEGSLKLTGLDEEFEVAYNDIYAMETVTEHMKNLTSAGELKEVDVTGVKLDDILASKNISQKDFEVIRLIAGDGYSIDVPADIISQKDIVLAFEFDGKPLEDKAKPMRAAINDVRTMYWVSNLKEINFSKKGNSGAEASSGSNKVIFLETAMKSLEEHDYTYYEKTDKAVKVDDLFKAYIPTASSDVNFVAADGFEKSEKIDVLLQGYIKNSGEDVPLFLSPDLPKGMQVKNILALSCADTSFVSAAHSIETLTSKEVQGAKGAALEEVAKVGNLKADSYLITAADGYNVEITSEDLSKGILYKNNDGLYAVKFSEDLPKSTNIKDIISIEVSKGEKAVEGDKNNETASKTWEITFEGLSDGSFVLGNEKAESKLTLVSIKATKKSKSGEEFVQAWDGYKVLDVLKFLHVEDFKALKVVASDGYEMELTKDEIDDDSILGVSVDGEKLSDDTNLVQFVSKGLPSNKWVKGVSKIIVVQ